jgi:hypothetical protein
VTLRDGRSFSKSSPDLLGFPARPHTRADVVRKFKSNAQLVIADEQRLEELIKRLETLEEVRDISEIMSLTFSA